MSMTPEYQKRRDAYHKHRHNAKGRGIPWLFTYTSWWRKWCESRKWHLRGRKIGQYVMSRPGDKGPYAPWNVKIVKAEENVSDGNIGNVNATGNTARRGKKHTSEAKTKMSAAHKGKIIPNKVRSKISKTLTGQSKSTITKRKMSIAQKARREREKIV